MKQLLHLITELQAMQPSSTRSSARAVKTCPEICTYMSPSVERSACSFVCRKTQLVSANSCVGEVETRFSSTAMLGKRARSLPCVLK
eukprot:6206567-Pleurochrysis_carterae.AAC.1